MMRFGHSLFAAASAICVMGCSYTLSQSFTFTPSETTSLAVVDYPSPDNRSTAMNTVVFRGVDLETATTNDVVVALEPAIVGTKQLRPNLALDDGSLYPLEKAAQQTMFVPLELAPGDYMIAGGLGPAIGYGVAAPGGVIAGASQQETTFCRAPLFRILPSSIAIVDSRAMLARSGNKNFSADPDPQRSFRRGKIALGAYPQVTGDVVQAQYLGTAVFADAAGVCSGGGNFRFERAGD
jgi:hypothetical protein